MNFFICVIAILLIFLGNFSYFVIFGCFHNIFIRFFLQILLVVGHGGGSWDPQGASTFMLWTVTHAHVVGNISFSCLFLKITYLSNIPHFCNIPHFSSIFNFIYYFLLFFFRCSGCCGPGLQ